MIIGHNNIVYIYNRVHLRERREIVFMDFSPFSCPKCIWKPPIDVVTVYLHNSTTPKLFYTNMLREKYRKKYAHSGNAIQFVAQWQQIMWYYSINIGYKRHATTIITERHLLLV